MKLRWTPEAEQDREDIFDYIAQDNEPAAVTMDALFSDAAHNLTDFPQIGRIGQIPGTREWIPHESYRLVYEIEGDTVWILALVSTSKQWPPANRKR